MTNKILFIILVGARFPSKNNAFCRAAFFKNHEDFIFFERFLYFFFHALNKEKGWK